MDQIQTREILKSDPGDPRFVELASTLHSENKLLEAMEVCLAGLSANPSVHEGRLLLARVLFEKGYYPFAAQELRTLNLALPDNDTVARLLEKLSPGSSVSGESAASDPDETVAESDFDLDILEAIGDEDDD